ncbi:MAG: TetR/AcrR family transcriptional regulator [Pseudomonadota bacterium]
MKVATSRRGETLPRKTVRSTIVARKVGRRAPARPAASRGAVRRDNRRQRLLDAAARQFRERGFAAASMRAIAASAEMLAGSTYYHFPSKQELLVAVHEEGIRRISAAVAAALEGIVDPWDRLEAACTAHLDLLLAGGDYAQVVIRDLPREAGSARRRLIEMRDAYEDVFRRLIADLPLPAEADRRLVRLMLLGALNWSPRWYRAKGDSPARIARHFVWMVRRSLGPGRN